jgi:hypothetical protein
MWPWPVDLCGIGALPWWKVGSGIHAGRRDPCRFASAAWRSSSNSLVFLRESAAPSSPWLTHKTLDNVQARRYPLLRDVCCYLKREKGKPLDAKAKELLRYVLSREGQAAVQRDGKYLA